MRANSSTRSVSRLFASAAARSASRVQRCAARSAASSTTTPASAATPSCQAKTVRARAIAIGSSTAPSMGVTKLMMRPTRSGPVAATACLVVAVCSALNQSSRMPVMRSATVRCPPSRMPKPSVKPRRDAAASTSQPTTVVSASAPSHGSASAGEAPQSAVTSGTRSTAPTARSRMPETLSARYPAIVRPLPAGSRARSARIIGVPPARRLPRSRCRPAVRRLPATACGTARLARSARRACRSRRFARRRARRCGRHR